MHMKSLTASRADALDLVATTLLRRSSLLMRLLTSFGARELSRTEAGLLLTILDGPRRITELAETEALAQPTVTKVVDKLEQRGLVARERSAGDGRVVLVSISPEGRQQVEASRIQVQALMRETVEGLSDKELADLVAASETLGRMIETLQQRRGSA
jgi:DNA-binding MarR family transcriptional regulator